jgi:hypothetical protein
MPTALSKRWREWEQIGSPDCVLDWIKEGVKLPFSGEPLNCEYSNHKLSKNQASFVSSEITSLLNNGCISNVDYKPHCVVPIGCVPKKNRKQRLIVDLRHVNSFSESRKFRYEDLSTLSQVIRPGDYMVSLDLKNCFSSCASSPRLCHIFGVLF